MPKSIETMPFVIFLIYSNVYHLAPGIRGCIKHKAKRKKNRKNIYDNLESAGYEILRSKNIFIDKSYKALVQRHSMDPEKQFF